MNARTVDLWAGAVVVLVGLITLFLLIPKNVSAGVGFGLSPRAFPYLCAGAITGLGMLLIVTNLRGSDSTDRPAPLRLKALKRLAVVLALLVVTLALMQWVGFLAASVVAVAALMVLMGERRWLPIVLTSLGWSLFLWLLFDRMLGAPLP